MSSILDIYLKGVERRHNQSSGHDRVTPDTIDREAFYQDRSQSSWQERVKIMWVPSDEGDYSPELNMVRTSTIFSGLAGASAGVILKASDARKKFMTQNRHEIFENSLVAERKLLDIMAWTGIKNGFAWGWRCAAMTLIFTGGTLRLSLIIL